MDDVLDIVRWLSEAVDAFVSWRKSTGSEAHRTRFPRSAKNFKTRSQEDPNG
jgi:hypothetical protein